MIIFKRLAVSCSVGAFILFTLGAASASATTYTFNIDHCGGGCGTGSLGTVSVTDVTVSGNAEVQVAVQLANGLFFVNTGGSKGLGGSLVFNINGNPTITDEIIPTGFSLESTTGGSIHMNSFGYFGYGINCTVCGNGGMNATSNPTSLTFDLSGNFNAASLAALSTGGSPDAYFAADVYSSATGNTGAIGSSASVTSTPEPSSLLLLGFGLIGIAVFPKRLFGRVTR